MQDGKGSRTGLEREKDSIQNLVPGGFSGGTVVKNPPAKVGNTGSSPGLGRSHMPRSN